MEGINPPRRGAGAGWVRRVAMACGGGVLTARPFRHNPQPLAAASVCQAHCVRLASAQPSEQYTVSRAGNRAISTNRHATQSLRTAASIDSFLPASGRQR